MSMRLITLILMLVGLFFIGGCGGEGAGFLVDAVFVNGHVVTMDEGRPVAEAMAVRGGRIVAVGSTAEIESTYFYPERVDLRGQTVMPGIVESHGHLPGLRERFRELNMNEILAPEEVLEKIGERLGQMEAGYSGVVDDNKGELRAGMAADFIVISAEVVGDVVVEERYVGGVLVYDRRVGANN